MEDVLLAIPVILVTFAEALEKKASGLPTSGPNLVKVELGKRINLQKLKDEKRRELRKD